MNGDDIFYPKTLVVTGEPFSESSATGITLSRIFADWSPSRLANIFTANMMPQGGMCGKFGRLGLQALFPFSLAGGINFHLSAPGAKVVPNERPATDATGGRLSPKAWAREQARMALDLLPYSLPVEAKEFVSSFAPDVVYSLLGSNCVMRLAMNIAAYARVPLVPHFMDDWPETLHSGSVLSPVLRRMMYSRLAEVTGRAPFALMIGDAMAREYSEKYGIVCHQFMNCVDETFFGDSAPTRAGDVVRFAYFGGLHFNRWKGLQEVGRSLEALSREGLKAEMAIYTHFKAAQEYAHLFPQGGLARIAGTLAPGDVPEAQRLADCLVHVESFDLRCRKYTRLSVSTKIPEYMASSRPILAYGPQEIASLAYVAENQAGIAVSAHSPDKLTHALRRLITDRDLRSRLGANGRAVAMRRHRAVTERERFRALLSYAVNGGH